MNSSKNFILQDEGSFVKEFDIERQKLTMTQDRTEAHFFTLSAALEVVERLGYLASERLVVKAVEGALKSR